MRSTVGRSIVLLFMLAVCILWVHCGKDKSSGPDDKVSNTDFVAKESFRFAVDAEDHTGLSLEGINGNVTITGLSGADSVIVAGEKRVGSESMQDAEEHLQDLQVNVWGVQGVVFVKTTQPDQTQGRAYVVDYDITLPKSLQVLVINVNGAVTIDSINSFISVQNVNGPVTLEEIFGSVSVQLVNGQIQAEVTLPQAGLITMSAVNGGIELAVPQNTSAEFSASVENGIISMSNLVLQDLRSTPNSLTGTLGDGQGTISLTTVNGSISVWGF
ncbi:MAG: DUF4097 family beta strand repeat protein [candidate division Zixibacteria bacterium]|nr:DUF4097 family beta strand repeat protein [candidate division Zixibacteria bacterium]